MAKLHFPFQTTINEAGLCYTFNNYDLGMDSSASSRPSAISVRNVRGCGKRKGLRVVVDSRRLANQPLFAQAQEFVVYVTVPGVVTHKVPFKVHSSVDDF